jgi:hypothetical protein
MSHIYVQHSIICEDSFEDLQEALNRWHQDVPADESDPDFIPAEDLRDTYLGSGIPLISKYASNDSDQSAAAWDLPIKEGNVDAVWAIVTDHGGELIERNGQAVSDLIEERDLKVRNPSLNDGTQ